MSDDKVTKEIKPEETRGAREVTPPKQQPRPSQSSGKGK